ncbi:MAG: 2-dehydropantoate 2-reductase [Rhizobiaceae bacterium]|nr:2-dehydropantoate 2-reductase [Rhizobiaceae bacterium]
MSTPILIWGAGAIGGTLGASFIRAGHEGVFVDNAADHVAAINAKGLRIDGPIYQDTVKAKAYLPEELEGTFDRIFLCVKAHHTAHAAKALLPHVAADGYVVSAQNGLNENVIADIIGKERVIGCFVNFGADYLEPGVVHYSGHGAVVVGELDGKMTPRIQAIYALMLQFEPKAILTDNIWGYLWGKLIYGALLFGTALTNDSIADVLANPTYRPVLTQLAHEIGKVAEAQNIVTEAFNGFDPTAFAPSAPAAETARSFDEMVVHNRKSAKSHSGIWRDLAVRKRKTEVDAQVLPVVEIGRSLGVPTPLAARVVTMIHEIEDGKRPLDLANLDDLARAAA